MKRTVKNPDGTEEVLEGTSEEIAEYMRRREEQAAKKKKPEVLKGSETDPQKAIEEALRIFQPTVPAQQNPIFVACSRCWQNPCACQFWFTPYITCNAEG